MVELDFAVHDLLDRYTIKCDTILIKPDFANNFIDISTLTEYKRTE